MKQVNNSTTINDICHSIGNQQTNVKVLEADLDQFQNVHRQDENNKLNQFLKHLRDHEQMNSHLVKVPQNLVKKYVHRPFESLKFPTESGRELMLTESASPTNILKNQKSETSSPTLIKSVSNNNFNFNKFPSKALNQFV